MGQALGTFSGRTNHRIRLETQVAGQNIAGNYSAINWQLYAEKTSASTSYYLTANGSGSVNIGGNVFGIAGWSYDFRSQTTITLGSGTVNIGHAADGTMSYGLSASASTPGTLGSASCASSEAAAQIPRTTTPTLSPGSGETAQTYTIGHSPASGTFTHDVFYSLNGGANYTAIAADTAALSTAWTPAHTLLPSSSGVTAIILVRTKSGATIIGDRTMSLPLAVPASLVPTVSAVTWADAQTLGPDIPTLMGGAGRFVQRWSKLIPTVTSAGAGGSTVTSSSVTEAGKVTQSGTAFTQPVLLSGTVPFSATAADTRGRSSAAFSGTVPVTAYNYPSLPTPLVARTSDAAGNIPSPTGTFIAITPAASTSPLVFGAVAKNILEWRIRTKPAGGAYTLRQDWTAATVSGNTWTTKHVAAGSYAASSEFVVEVSVRDLFGQAGFATASTVVVLEVLVRSETVFMDWNQGVGVGLGKYHNNGMLDVAGQIFQNDGKAVVDIVQLSANLTRKGTVSATWMYGPIPVTITDALDATASITATLAGDVNPTAIKPGAEVLLSRTGATWVITGVTAAARTIRRTKLVLQNGWTDYGDGSNFYGSPSIWVDSNGIVGLEGLLFRATVPADASVIANLPAGMGAPAAGTLIFAAANNGGMGQLRIVGDTLVYNGGGAVGFFSLENARWRHGSIARTPLPLNGTWTNYAQGFAPPAFTIDSNGVVLVEGLVTGGSTTGISPIATFPVTIQGPTDNMHNVTVASGAFSYFRIGGSTGSGPGRVLNWGTGTSNAWISLCCSFVDNSSPLVWKMFINGLSSGWIPYGPNGPTVGQQQPGFTRTPGGLGFVRGLWKAGTVGAAMARAPHEVMPDLAEAKIFATVSSDLFARFDMVNSTAQPNQIILNNGSSTWASTEAMWRIGSTYTGPDQGIFSA